MYSIYRYDDDHFTEIMYSMSLTSAKEWLKVMHNKFDGKFYVIGETGTH